jgi:hypothetical protein
LWHSTFPTLLPEVEEKPMASIQDADARLLEQGKPPPDLPQLLGALPTPPEVIEEVDAHCHRYGRRSAWDRAAVEDRLKLRYYFGGRTIAAVATPAGLFILAAGLTDPEEVGALVARQRAQGQQVTLLTPSPWQDTDTEILTWG